jgi:hypothetical protein
MLEETQKHGKVAHNNAIKIDARTSRFMANVEAVEKPQ